MPARATRSRTASGVRPATGQAEREVQHRRRIPWPLRSPDASTPTPRSAGGPTQRGQTRGARPRMQVSRLRRPARNRTREAVSRPPGRAVPVISGAARVVRSRHHTRPAEGSGPAVMQDARSRVIRDLARRAQSRTTADGRRRQTRGGLADTEPAPLLRERSDLDQLALPQLCARGNDRRAVAQVPLLAEHVPREIGAFAIVRRQRCTRSSPRAGPAPEGARAPGCLCGVASTAPARSPAGLVRSLIPGDRNVAETIVSVGYPAM